MQVVECWEVAGIGPKFSALHGAQTSKFGSSSCEKTFDDANHYGLVLIERSILTFSNFIVGRGGSGPLLAR